MAASLLVLASPLTLTSCQRVFVDTITNFSHTSPATSSLSFSGSGNSVNSGSGSVIGASGSNVGSGLPTATGGSSSASTGSNSSSTGSSSSASNSSGSSSSIEISGSASSAGLKVYSNSACTSSTVSLNWGSISPGGTATATVYVKNTGNSDSLTLSIQASNWNPTSASRYLTLSWNKQGTVLAAGQSTEATITLTVSSSITGITSFSVRISISGTS